MSRLGQKLWFVSAIALAMAPSFAQASGPERFPGSNEEPEARRAATPRDIEKVIRQLGSKQFKEREAANKALLAIGYPALEALRKAAAHDNDAEVRARSAALVRQIENQFDTLAADYRAFGLPLPPRGAKLVCFPEYVDVRRTHEAVKLPDLPLKRLAEKFPNGPFIEMVKAAATSNRFLRFDSTGTVRPSD